MKEKPESTNQEIDCTEAKRRAKKYLAENLFIKAYKMALKGDRKDPEISYILGRCLENEELYNKVVPVEKRFYSRSFSEVIMKGIESCIQIEHSMKYYARAIRKDKSGKIGHLVNERKYLYNRKLLNNILLWPMPFLKYCLDKPSGEIVITIIAVFLFSAGAILCLEKLVPESFLTALLIIGLIFGYFCTSLFFWLICKLGNHSWDSKMSETIENLRKKD